MIKSAKIKSLIIGFALFAGCSSARVRHNPVLVSDLLFPSGIYHHDISLTIKATAAMKQKNYQFSGVVRLSKNEINAVALSAFGTTEFRINEDLKSGSIQTEVYRESFKKLDPKLREYYAILRLILLAKSKHSTDQGLLWKRVNENGNPLELEATGPGQDSRFEILKYDINQIPEVIKIENLNFIVEVKVTGYEI